MRLAAGFAVRFRQLAVQMENVLGTGTLVEIVDVLGDQGEVGDALCQGGEGVMSGVRRGAQDLHAAPLVPPPDQCGVVSVRGGGCELGGVELLPESRLFVPERRDAALRRDAGAGEYGHPAGVA